MEALTQETLEKTDWISWSAYHASIQETVIPPAAINALLPLFLDSAHSVPGSSPYSCRRSTTVCPRQANTVDLARYFGRGPLHSDVWWITHRDGLVEGM